MKHLITALTAISLVTAAQAEILYFDLSPIGTSPATGLSPSNEVHMVVDSTGSGGEVLSGISFDSETLTLNLAVGYGSVAGFADLTGPATAAHIHGPASATEAAGVLVDLGGILIPAGDPARGGLLFGSVLLDEQSASNLLAGLTYINIHTETNQMGEIRGQLILDDNQAPTITSIDPLTLECTGESGTVGTLSTTVTDLDDDEITVVWKVDGNDYQTNVVAAGTSAAGSPVQFMGSFGLGTHEIIVTATDPSGETAITMTTVTVVDTTPPEIKSITATPNVLWPPNHRLIPVRITVDASDTCGPVRARILDVYSSESPNGLGDGNTSPDYSFADVTVRSVKPRKRPAGDWRLISPLRVYLRAERSGNGSGRVYTVVVEVRDSSDNVSTGTVEIVVPHDRGRSNANGYAPSINITPTPTQPAPPPAPVGNANGNGNSNGNGNGKPNGNGNGNANGRNK